MRPRCDFVSSTGESCFAAIWRRLGDGEDVRHQRCSTLKVSAGSASRGNGLFTRSSNLLKDRNAWQYGTHLIGRQVQAAAGKHSGELSFIYDGGAHGALLPFRVFAATIAAVDAASTGGPLGSWERSGHAGLPHALSVVPVAGEDAAPFFGTQVQSARLIAPSPLRGSVRRRGIHWPFGPEEAAPLVGPFAAYSEAQSECAARRWHGVERLLLSLGYLRGDPGHHMVIVVGDVVLGDVVRSGVPDAVMAQDISQCLVEIFCRVRAPDVVRMQ